MSSIEVTVNRINIAATIIVITVSIVNFVLGAIGLIFNVLVFIRPSLRREPFSYYFFASTCFNLFVIFIIIPVRIVSEDFNIDLANYNLGICKTEIFAFYAVRTISCWLIVLACVDRYLHSSPKIHIRRMSSLKTTRIVIGVTIIVIIILYSHMIGFYEITNVSNQFGNIAPVCYGRKGIYRTFLGFWYMVLYSLCPSFFMLLFGFLTLNNVRHHRRVIPIAFVTNRLVRRRNIQLLRMLAAQVLVIIISTLPFSIYRLYASFTVNLSKDTLRLAQENLSFQVASSMTYFAHSSSFYLYTLTGKVFRKELLTIIQRCQHRNLVEPLTRQTYQMSILRKTQQTMTTRNNPGEYKDNAA